MMALPASVVAQNFAGDMALSKVLIKGEDWERVATGFESTDGATSDGDGNFYFAGRQAGNGKIFKATPQGDVSVYIADAPGISGLQFAPNGQLYGTRWGKNDLVRFEVNGTYQTIATGNHPNDLVITSQGHVFFTSADGVSFLNQQGVVTNAAKGLAGANGISLSPDQGTLIVSEYQGKHAWAYRVEADGRLSFGEPYMTLRLPFGKDASRGDGATTDVEGRYYITSSLGLQMFDATGRISGLILYPNNRGASNVTFAGEGHRYLYLTAGNDIYRRLTKTHGVLFFKDFEEGRKISQP